MTLWDRWRRREPVTLTCYTRSGCCLCERAEATLRRMERRGGVRVEWVSIEGDAALTALYGERIPVVCLGAEVLAEGKVSELWLMRALEGRRAAGHASSARA